MKKITVKGFINKTNSDDLNIINGEGISNKGVIALDFEHELDIVNGDIITLVLTVENDKLSEQTKKEVPHTPERSGRIG